MAKIDTGNVVNKKSYIFFDQAQNEQNILPAIQAEANAQRLPVKISVRKMKSGGMFMGTKEEVICFQGGGFSPIYIITRTVGVYLYISIVTMAVADFTKVENIFVTESFLAYWNACQSCLEIALSNLGLKEYSQKFTGI